MMVKLYSYETGETTDVDDAVDVINSDNIDGVIVVSEDGTRETVEEDIIFAAWGGTWDVWIEPRHPQINVMPWKNVENVALHPDDMIVGYVDGERREADGEIKRVSAA